MNSYMIIAIGIAAAMAVLLLGTFTIAIFKGIRAGSMEIQVTLMGIFKVVIHLKNVSKNRD